MAPHQTSSRFRNKKLHIKDDVFAIIYFTMQFYCAILTNESDKETDPYVNTLS